MLILINVSIYTNVKPHQYTWVCIDIQIYTNTRLTSTQYTVSKKATELKLKNGVTRIMVMVGVRVLTLLYFFLGHFIVKILWHFVRDSSPHFYNLHTCNIL